MTPDLSRKLGRLLSLSAATPFERDTLVQAVAAPGVKTIEDLPPAGCLLMADLHRRANRRRDALSSDAAPAAVLAASIVDELAGDNYTAEQRQARGEWLRWSKEQFAQAVAESKVGRDPKGKFAKKGTPGKSLKSSWADRIASGVVSETRLSDRNNASHVDLVQFGDGSRAVVKVSKSDSETAKAEFDAEELGAKVATALRLRPPDVHRSDDGEAYFSYVHDTAPDAVVGAEIQPTDVNLDSVSARRVGLLDALIENGDRNEGNWFDDGEGTLIPIDHGQAWEPSHSAETPTAPTTVYQPQTFSGYLIQPVPIDRLPEVPTRADIYEWADNDLSPAYLKALRPELEALRPEFERRGRGDWFERMLTRLDIVTSHAKGTVKL